MDPLSYDELSHEDKMALESIQAHPGFRVMKRLLEDACNQATTNAIKLNPEDPQYDLKLKTRHMIARITNDVVATLLKSIAMHSKAAQIEEQVKKVEQILKAESGLEETETESRYGTMRVKRIPEKGEVESQ